MLTIGDIFKLKIHHLLASTKSPLEASSAPAYRIGTEEHFMVVELGPQVLCALSLTQKRPVYFLLGPNSSITGLKKVETKPGSGIDLSFEFHNYLMNDALEIITRAS